MQVFIHIHIFFNPVILLLKTYFEEIKQPGGVNKDLCTRILLIITLFLIGKNRKQREYPIMSQ